MPVIEIANTNLTLGATYRTTFLADSDRSVNNILSRKWTYVFTFLWQFAPVASGTVLSGFRVSSRRHVFEWTVDELFDVDFAPTPNVDKAVSAITSQLNKDQRYGVKLAPLETEIISAGTAPSKNILEKAEEAVEEAGKAAGNLLDKATEKAGEAAGNLFKPFVDAIKPILLPLGVGLLAVTALYFLSKRGAP